MQTVLQVKSGTDGYPVPFILRNTDGSRATGATVSASVSPDNSGGFTAGAGSFVELGGGAYRYLIAQADYDGAEHNTTLRFTATGCEPTEVLLLHDAWVDKAGGVTGNINGFVLGGIVGGIMGGHVAIRAVNAYSGTTLEVSDAFIGNRVPVVGDSVLLPPVSQDPQGIIAESREITAVASLGGGEYELTLDSAFAATPAIGGAVTVGDGARVQLKAINHSGAKLDDLTTIKGWWGDPDDWSILGSGGVCAGTLANRLRYIAFGLAGTPGNEPPAYWQNLDLRGIDSPDAVWTDDISGITTPGTAANQLNGAANAAATAASAAISAGDGVQTLLNRLGAFTGTGVNTVLGFFAAMMGKTETKPSDAPSSYTVATDSLEALRDRGDAAWTSGGSVDLTPVTDQLTTIEGKIDTVDTNVDAVQTIVTTNLDVAVSSRLASGDVTVAAASISTIRSGLSTLTTSDIDGRLAANNNAAADALLDRSNGVESGLTLRQWLRLGAASLFGKIAGAGTTTVTARDYNDTKDRITATVDEDGNRTAVTRDVS